MATGESIVLYPQVDSHDLGPQHIDLNLYPGGDGTRLRSTRAHLSIATPDGPLALTLIHPVQPGTMRMAPGIVQVESSQGSSLTLYTFGGTLTSNPDQSQSVGHMESEAPILLIGKSLFDNDLNPIDLVLDEFQAWLSILRARSIAHLPAFYRQLLSVSPFTLYVQALILAERTLGAIPIDDRSERYWRSHRTIHGALESARKRPGAPVALPNLEQVLLATS